MHFWREFPYVRSDLNSTPIVSGFGWEWEARPNDVGVDIPMKEGFRTLNVGPNHWVYSKFWPWHIGWDWPFLSRWVLAHLFDPWISSRYKTCHPHDTGWQIHPNPNESPYFRVGAFHFLKVEKQIQESRELVHFISIKFHPFLLNIAELRWSSSCGGMQVKFDPNLWAPLPQYFWNTTAWELMYLPSAFQSFQRKSGAEHAASATGGFFGCWGCPVFLNPGFEFSTCHSQGWFLGGTR